MKYILFSSLILSAHFASAYAPDEVANRTLVCGSTTLRFGPGAEKASVDGKTVDVGWGNRGIDAVIGDHDLTVKGNGKYELDGERCTFKK